MQTQYLSAWTQDQLIAPILDLHLIRKNINYDKI